MIKKKVNGVVIEIPKSMFFNGEEYLFTDSDLIPIFKEDAHPDDEPIFFDLHVNTSDYGLIINSLCQDYEGDVIAFSYPSDEKDIDTNFNLPQNFLRNVKIYNEYY